MHLDIVKADVSHATAIAAIGRKSFFDTFYTIFTVPADLNSYLDRTFGVQKISGSLQSPRNIYYLASCNGTPAGFVKLKLDSSHPALSAVWQLELQKIYVLHEFLGNGTGKALMDHAVQKVQELQPDVLWLDVHIHNDRARRFYEKYGFVRKGLHQFTIGSQTFDFDVMALSINKDH